LPAMSLQRLGSHLKAAFRGRYCEVIAPASLGDASEGSAREGSDEEGDAEDHPLAHHIFIVTTVGTPRDSPVAEERHYIFLQCGWIDKGARLEYVRLHSSHRLRGQGDYHDSHAAPGEDRQAFHIYHDELADSSSSQNANRDSTFKQGRRERDREGHMLRASSAPSVQVLLHGLSSPVWSPRGPPDFQLPPPAASDSANKTTSDVHQRTGLSWPKAEASRKGSQIVCESESRSSSEESVVRILVQRFVGFLMEFAARTTNELSRTTS